MIVDSAILLKPNELSRKLDIAWAAGLFEGEGCFTHHRVRTWQGDAYGYAYFRMTLGMTDEDVVRRFGKIIGCGKVRESHTPSAQKNGDKKQWRWEVEGEKAKIAYKLLKPYLGKRRKRRAQELLRDCR